MESVKEQTPTFTPGPWEFDGEVGVYATALIEMTTVQNEHGEQVPHKRGLVALVYGPSPDGTYPQKENGRLIASAPDLYAALVKAKEAIRAWHSMGHYEGEADHVWQLYQDSPEMRAINAAIAKAERG